MVKRPVYSLAILYCYIPALRGRNEGRQRRSVFSVLHLSGEGSCFYIFFDFYCNVLPCIDSYGIFKYCRRALYEV